MLVETRDGLLASLNAIPAFAAVLLLAFPVLTGFAASRALPLPGLLRIPAGLAIAALCLLVAPMWMRLPEPLSGPLGDAVAFARSSALGLPAVRLGDAADLRPEDADLVRRSWSHETSQDADLLAPLGLLDAPSAPGPSTVTEVLVELAGRVDRGLAGRSDGEIAELLQLLESRVAEERLALDLAFVPAARRLAEDGAQSEVLRDAAASFVDSVRSEYAQVFDDAYFAERLRAVFGD